MSDGVPLVSVRIDDKRCTYCLECVNTCPNGALTYYRACFMHNAYECAYCEVCMDVCEVNALSIMEVY